MASIFFGTRMDSMLGAGVLFSEGKDLMSNSSKVLHWHEGIIAFGKKPALAGWHCHSYGYVCNADGSIRWLYPLGLRKPIFLRLYNSAGWRGRLVSTAFRLAFLMGVQRLLRQGVLHVVAKRRNKVEELVEKEQATAHAIFTGTVGANRKAVVVLQKNNADLSFCKVPLTASADSLVRNEAAVLNQIPSDQCKHLVAPKARCWEGNLLLSDVRPKKYFNSNKLKPVHLRALSELARSTHKRVPLQVLPVWQSIHRRLHALGKLEAMNALDAATTEKLKNALLRLRQQFDPTTEVATCLAHADFTPWNLYLSAGKVHLYDWEMAEYLPVLYDAFHFVFQAGILLRRQTFEDLRTEIAALRENPLVKQLLDDYRVDFEMHYRFYLLNNASYYLPRYLQQQPLHEQAHWLVATWLKACEAALEPAKTIHPLSLSQATAL